MSKVFFGLSNCLEPQLRTVISFKPGPSVLFMPFRVSAIPEEPLPVENPSIPFPAFWNRYVFGRSPSNPGAACPTRFLHVSAMLPAAHRQPVCRNPSRRFLPSWNCTRARSSSAATNRVCCFCRQRAVHKAFACPKSRFLSTPPPSPFHLPGRNLFIFFPHRCAPHPDLIFRNPESKTHCCYPCSRPFLLPKTQKTAASSSLAAVSV